MLNRVILFLIIYLCNASFVFAKLKTGTYSIEVLMVSLDGIPITNQKFILDNDTLITDSEGKLLISMAWHTDFCKGYKVRKCNNLMNAKYIVFSFYGNKAFVKNKWKKYGFRQNGKKTQSVTIQWPILIKQ